MLLLFNYYLVQTYGLVETLPAPTTGQQTNALCWNCELGLRIVAFLVPTAENDSYYYPQFLFTLDRGFSLEV
jgi:hypothetical protein